MKKSNAIFVLLLIFNLLSSCATQQTTTNPQTLHKMTTYILVRHAEKVKGVKNLDYALLLSQGSNVG